MWIGIDPGLAGAIVVLDPDGTLVAHYRMPTMPTGKGSRRAYNEQAIREILSLSPWKLRATIERAQPLPSFRRKKKPGAPKSPSDDESEDSGMRGSIASFAAGDGYGLLRGILVGIDIRYTAVPPRTWQAVMLSGEPHQGREQCKASAHIVACRLWPELAEPLRIKAAEGLADAALIAEYGRRAAR